jgi:hypothetical protein
VVVIQQRIAPVSKARTAAVTNELAGELPGLMPISTDDDDCAWIMPPPQYGRTEQAQRRILFWHGRSHAIA